MSKSTPKVKAKLVEEYDDYNPLITDEHRAIMRELGYIHESDVERISCTSPLSRKRWKSPVGVMFGIERWYSLVDLKRHLDHKVAEKLIRNDEESSTTDVVSLT